MVGTVRQRDGDIDHGKTERPAAHVIAHAVLDVAADVLGLVELRLLRQVADLEPGRRPRLADDVLVDAGHDPEQGGLSCTIPPGQANPVPFVELKGGIFKKSFPRVLYGNVAAA